MALLCAAMRRDYVSLLKFLFLSQVCGMYCHNQLYMPISTLKYKDAIKTSGHSSLKKYTSHLIERVWKDYEGYYCVRGELETEQNCNILTPTLMAITACLSRSSGLLKLGHSSHYSISSPTELNFLSPGLYNNLISTYFLRASQFCTQFNPSTVKVTPDLPISSSGCNCYLYRYISSFESLAGSEFNMQHGFSRMICCLLSVSNAHRVVFLPFFCFLVIVILLAIMLSVSFLMAFISPPSCFLM